MSNSKNLQKILKALTVSAGLCSVLLFTPDAFARGGKKSKERERDPKKMEQMVERFSADNMKLRLEKLETLKKAHHTHIDELYELKARHITELGKLRDGADLKDESSRAAFFKKFKEQQKEFKREEKALAKTFKRHSYDEKGDGYKKKMKDRKKNFKNKLKDD